MSKDVAALRIKPDDRVVKVGAPVQLNLFAENKRGNLDLIPGNSAVWVSSNDGVAEVNRQGRLIPRGHGAVTITATYAGVEARAAFTVVAGQ